MKFSTRLWFSSFNLAAALIGSTGAASASEPPDGVAQAAASYEPVLFAVVVNGMPAGEPVVLLRAGDGSLYVPELALRAWRLMPWMPTIDQDGISYYALDGMPGLRFEIVAATQTLVITAPPALMESTGIAGYMPRAGPLTPSATGLFLNYDLVAQTAGGARRLDGLFETGVYTPAGVGLATFATRWDERGTGATRLETNWTRPDPAGMHYLRLGDSVSRAGAGGSPVRFAGIQLARDFSTQPGFVTIPLPSIAGEAELPSVVDVYVDNVLAQSRDVPPGPFEITEVPIVTGGGEIQLVVRDVLGRETLVTERYYATRRLLRAGLADYSFETGFLRRRFGRASFDYGSPLVSGTYRRGVTDSFTAELHAAATPDAQLGALGASMAIADMGVLNASAAASHSARGLGARYQLGFESRGARLSYGASAELVGDDFVTIGGIASRRRPPRLTLRSFAGLPTGFGSLGLAYLSRDMHDGPDLEFLSASASIRLGRLGTLHLRGHTRLSGPADHAAVASLTVPLGNRISASAGAELSDDSLIRLSLQKSLPVGEGIGYRAGVQAGEIDRLHARLTYQAAFGTYDLAVDRVSSQTGVRLTASGGIATVEGELFAARKLSRSFATVQVGDYAGVRVYADNQHVGTTNASGRAVIPRLRPYDRNSVTIEVADLPIDTQIDEGELMVRPYDRSGVAVRFGVRPARAALVSLVREDGTPVPKGAWVSLSGRDGEAVVAPGGEVYLTGLAQENAGVAIWPAGRCSFTLRYPDEGDPQPRIGPLACREETP